MFIFDKKYIFSIYLITLTLFIIFYDYALPIATNPDEVTQLKNIYAMLQNKTIFMQYDSAYSIWVSYLYLLPTVIYWGIFYIYNDISNLVDFKFYILNNYIDVIGFLRIYTAIIFFVGLFFIRIVLEKVFNYKVSIIFFILTAFNLLIIINVHYAKHWMLAIGLGMISIYIYYRYLEKRELSKLIFSAILFGITIFSNSSLIFLSFYLILLHLHISKDVKFVFKSLIIFLSILIFIFLLTRFLGVAGLDSYAVEQFSKFNYLSNIKVIIQHIIGFIDYNLISFFIFIPISIYCVYIKKYVYFIFLLPSFLYLVAISFFHYEPRYGIFIIISINIFLAYGLNLVNNKKYILSTIYFYVIYSLILSIIWLNIISKDDTRFLAKNWLEKNINSNDFILYNVISFNYLPQTASSIDFIKENFPNALSTSEELHLKYNLTDGKNGAILWRIEQANYDIKPIIDKLLNRYKRVFIVKERFGKIAKHYDSATKSFEEINNNFNLKEIKRFNPYRYKDEIDDKLGDIILNFNYVLYNLYHIKQPGPFITIYEVSRI